MRNKLYFFLVACVVVCCYYFTWLEEIRGKTTKPKAGHKDNSEEIVAFSLMKQIELESEEFRCQHFFRKNRTKIIDEQRQWTQIEETNVYIYSIYSDLRLFPHQYVRSVAMVKGSWSKTLFCQTASLNGRYHVTKAHATRIWSKSWNQNDTHIYYNPYLISCHIPLNSTVSAITFSYNPCQLGNQKFLVPVPLPSIPHEFTICVKPMNFNEDTSVRLLQWITINRVLGADHFDFYVSNVPQTTLRLLKDLEQITNNSVTLYDFHPITAEATKDEITRVWQKRRYEIITYNDCLYRNLQSSHYIIPIDVDEIIVPRRVITWAELLRPEGVEKFASYTVRNAYYLRQFNVAATSADEKIFFLKSVVRSELSPEGESGKSFVSTKSTLTVFNHYALKTLTPGIGRIKFLKSELAQMNHYRDDCDVAILPQCAKYLSSLVRVVDDVIVKYKAMFDVEYTNLINKLSFYYF